MMPRGQYDRSKLAKPFRAPGEVQAQPEAPMALPDPPSAPEPAEASDAPWVDDRRRPIGEAPRDGETILLFSDKSRHGVKGRWRTTRKFLGGRWVVNKYWACPLTHKGLGDQWIEWEPVA